MVCVFYPYLLFVQLQHAETHAIVNQDYVILGTLQRDCHLPKGLPYSFAECPDLLSWTVPNFQWPYTPIAAQSYILSLPSLTADAELAWSSEATGQRSFGEFPCKLVYKEAWCRAMQDELPPRLLWSFPFCGSPPKAQRLLHAPWQNSSIAFSCSHCFP